MEEIKKTSKAKLVASAIIPIIILAGMIAYIFGPGANLLDFASIASACQRSYYFSGRRRYRHWVWRRAPPRFPICPAPLRRALQPIWYWDVPVPKGPL